MNSWTLFLCWLAAALAALPAAAADRPQATQAKGKAERVVMIVWDGMRPDFISRDHTPTLFALAQRGVNFQKHHAVYLSSTEVNGTALATGMYPARSGIIANREYRPDIDPLRSFGTESPDFVRRGDAAAGKYLGAATVAEIVQAAGFPTVVAGTKAVALLHDRSPKRDTGAAKDSVNLFQGKTLPETALDAIRERLGLLPASANFPNSAQDEWTTRALTEVLWKNEVPKFSVLWLSEPDFTQHQAGPGSEPALAALKSSDTQLATVLNALQAKGLLDSTDVFVVSDHGFSTISRAVDVATLLNDEGFTISRLEFKEPPQPADVLVVSNGGSILFYVTGHAEHTTNRLVESLQQSDFAGVIFSRAEIEGTFPLKQALIDSPSAPDVVMSFKWDAGKNKNSVPGMIVADANRKAGQGTHVTLSQFDLHNTLVAAGPDFRKGAMNTLPTGNVDVAPTILWILGIEPPQPMDGRVLFEAMTSAPEDAAKPEVKESRAETGREFDEAHWKQYLKTSRVGATIYIDEGNGGYSAHTD